MSFFLGCAVFGGVLLVLQLASGLVGLDGGGDHGGGHGAGHDHHGAVAAGLELFTLRTLAAALAFFGLGGEAARRAGLGLGAAVALALVAGALAAVAVAALMRALLRLESDGTVRIEGAVGGPATVYVPIPAARGGAGKVQLVLQGRTVEYQAVTPDGDPLRTGDAVLVIDVAGPGTLVVARAPEAFG